MPVVKRYPNRKLYDTQAKKYITLDGIADLIRQGEDVRIIDHASGEDMTALTLTQIILEQEKKQSGLLPHSLLTGLIRASGDRLTALQKTLFSATFWQQIDEEIKYRIQNLIRLGEISEEDGQDLLDKLMHPKLRTQSSASAREQSTSIGLHELELILQQRQVPTQGDLQRLYAQLEALADKIEQISESEAA